MDGVYLAAEKAIVQALALKKREQFLLVTDKFKMEIAEALAHWAKKVGAETTTYLMTESLRPVTEPTTLFRLLCMKASAMAYMLDARMEEKPFRGYMVKAGVANSRICMMPGLTLDMMERLVNIDFRELDMFGKKLVEKLADSENIIVENAEGTHVEFSVKARTWKNDNGDISQKGMHGNLPAGEVFTAPVEESFSGRLVISLIDDKLGKGIMEFEKGRLTGFEGEGIEEIVAHIGEDDTGKIIGEFGIGTNPKAKICPNMLEAEKAFGTAHFAIGDSYGIGINTSPHHYDALVDKVSIRTNGEYIIQDGKFLI
ncbi:MAG: aminopeptidase [Candidatus Aminicenantes bacterium]|nr:MAG: aminopeptidase [Candidatus Aminicenantes bacterium]